MIPDSIFLHECVEWLGISDRALRRRCASGKNCPAFWQMKPGGPNQIDGESMHT